MSFYTNFFKHISDPEMRDKKEKIAELFDEAQKLQFELADLVHPKLREHPPKKGLPNFMFPVIGSWECKDSPIGVCVYNEVVDRIRDHCLYCEEPDERK